MAAIAPFYVHAASPGVLMTDIGLVGDEDFLLIHSVEDSAEYGQEIKRFNTLGKKIYHVLQDPSLQFAFDCDCLALEGLANGHPGQAVTMADINNILPSAFGWPSAAGTLCHYRRPRRRRSAGNLASIQFELHVELATSTISLSPASLSAATWGNPSTILSGSIPTFPATASIFGSTIFWRRRAVLDYSGVSDPTDLLDIETFEYCQEWKLASPQPIDLAEFLADVDAVADTAENEIVEVYHVPSATHWVSDPEDNRIPALLAASTDPIDVQVFPDLAGRLIAIWLQEGGEEPDLEVYFSHETDLQDFLDTYNDGDLDNGIRSLISLYCMQDATWWHGP